MKGCCWGWDWDWERQPKWGKVGGLKEENETKGSTKSKNKTKQRIGNDSAQTLTNLALTRETTLEKGNHHWPI